MLDYEQRLWNDGIEFVAGVDEVGRGCLLGDVVAAAVIWPKHLAVEDIRDSKRLTERQREQWFEYIHNNALAVSIGSVDAATIDIINIKQAARLAMEKGCGTTAHHTAIFARGRGANRMFHPAASCRQR